MLIKAVHEMTIANMHCLNKNFKQTSNKFADRRKVQPEMRPGVEKYNGYRQKTGLFSVKSFPGLRSLPASMLEALISAVNNSLTVKTQKQYKSVRKHLTGCQTATNVRMSLPMGECQVQFTQ